MSTSLQIDPSAARSVASKDNKDRLNAWLREPLMHFIVLGLLLFTVDHFLFTRADDPHTIVVGAEVDREAQQVFKASRGREANTEELAALRKIWLDNEVLYREGIALQVDKGDTGIRERVIFKALSIVDANLKRPPLDDKVLREWFEGHRSKYDEPARFDFKEAVLSEDNSEAAARTFASALNAGTPGDAKAGLRVFKGRPKANLLQSYGDEFAKALEQATPGEWRAQSTKEGWRVIQLEALSPGKPAEFEALHGVVLQDWTDAVMAEQRSAAVNALAKKYKIQTEGAAK
jgi:hypothetical protein